MKVSISSIKAGTKFSFVKNTLIGKRQSNGRLAFLYSDDIEGPFIVVRGSRYGYVYFENVSGEKFRVFSLNVNVEID